MQSSTARVQQPSNQRQHRRYDFEVEVKAGSGHQFFTGFTENISAGGLFVQTYQTMPLGSVFQMHVKLPNVEEPFHLDCEVRWVREYNEMMPEMQPGMGVRFVNLAPHEEAAFNACLTRMETMFYDDEEL